jgi:hypothetical protein
MVQERDVRATHLAARAGADSRGHGFLFFVVLLKREARKPGRYHAAMMADLLVVVHFAIVLFIVGGLAAVWVGAPLGWRWVRNPWFRYLHLAAIGYVAAEALLGVACPLTVWEDLLRGGAQPDSFVGRWVRRLLFYDVPEWVFTVAYVAWALATLATLRLAPPRRKAA